LWCELALKSNGVAIPQLRLMRASDANIGRKATMRLSGKTALLTGSSSGIGRAIALRFAREGAEVAINGRDEKKIAGVVKEAEASGRRALGIRANVGSFAESKAMVARVQKEFGHLDILVCSAGVFHHTPFLKLSDEEWNEVLTVDLGGLFNCARAAIPQMSERKWGRVLFITATTGMRALPELAHICAAKHGAHGLAKSLAAEFAPVGITVNVIAPGLVDTPILGNFSEEALKEFKRHVPIGRIGHPDELAEAALYFASEESAYVTGQVLNMSGGTVI
jgi:3-oxoacyl-[acyl-carrier protein] reductase